MHSGTTFQSATPEESDALSAASDGGIVFCKHFLTAPEDAAFLKDSIIGKVNDSDRDRALMSVSVLYLLVFVVISALIFFLDAPLYLIGIPAAGCAAGWLLICFGRGIFRPLPWVRSPQWKSTGVTALADSGTPPRIQCICPKRHLPKLRPLFDQAFEPEVFNFSFVMGRSLGPRWLRVATPIAAFIVAVGLMWLVFRLLNINVIQFSIFLFIGLWTLFAATLWPIHARITPGRLEFVSAGFLGLRREKFHATVNLTTARLYVDLPGKTVLVVAPEGTGSIPLNFLTGRVKFVRYLMLASISTATPPPLPRDELVG